jgi:hypothetical protein
MRKKIINLNYIPDKETDLLKEDFLGTRPYVETLYKIVKDCNPPFTIGLLGGWGTGKSSIIRTLEKEFNEDTDSKVKVFIYDAWKYSRDSFRRTFILELLKYFKLDLHEKIKEKFYVSESKIIEKGISKIFHYKKSTIKTVDPVIYPEQFEQIFIETIAKVIGEPKNLWNYIKDIAHKRHSLKKVVIAIDNIDRCHRELAIELLLTIKNFLEIKNVVFIVPVDEEGLKKYLSSSNKDASDQDANEFLRKLFNTTLRIRDFSDNELFEFCSKLNEKYKLGFSDTLSSIISQEFSKNPRRIIQFLNTFQTEVLLAEEQEESTIPKGIITKNLPMLAKVIIIREEWPALYRLLLDNTSLLREINKAFKEKKFQYNEEKREWTLKNNNINLKLSNEAYRFLMRTQNVMVNNLEPFFVNKDVFQDIPDEINSLVLSQDWEAIKKHIKEGNISFQRLFDFICKKIDKDVIKRRLFKTSGFNILSLIFKIVNEPDYLSEMEKIFNTNSFNKVEAVLAMGEVKDLIPKFNPKELINFSKWLYHKKFTDLTTKIIDFINDIDVVKTDNTIEEEITIIKEFIQGFKDIPSCLKKIKNKFSKLVFSKPNTLVEFKDILENRKVYPHIISKELLTLLIDSLQADHKIGYANEKVNLIKLAFGCDAFNGFLTKFVNKVLPFSNVNDWSRMSFWFGALEGLIEKIEEKTLWDSVFNILKNRYQFLFNQYIGGAKTEINLKCYKQFNSLCRELYFSSDEFNNQIIKWLNDFFNRNESPEIYLYVNENYFEIVNYYEVYDWPFSQNVINKFVNLPWEHKKKLAKTLNLMLLKTTNENGLKKDQINSILDQYLNLIRTVPNEEIEETVKWLMEIKENEYIKGHLKERLNSISNPAEQMKYLEILKEMDKELLEESVTNIITHTSCENLTKIVDDLKEKIETIVVKKALKNRLNKLTTDNEEYVCYIEYLLDKDKILKLSKEFIGLIIIKVKPLLASDKKEKQVSALRLLSRIEEIPQKKKNLVKTLLEAINYKNFLDEEKRVLEKVKKKVI